ncbi:DUF4864 domain-containing protein [Fulvimarina sp. 2208YS6-2-32]|uniref:DUF4864 domain-containing protein n=2 Tax=Fulvimarina uroteuthidis TaxID=3098149 RepID=A0ABU5I3U8_9HYPH|nr:DUF4864 domain-containing protein [Fulvimarina sp. 2208YS6-2-32]
MNRLALRLAVLVALSGPMATKIAKADDASDVRAAITAQIEAFRADDGAAAYAFAAPQIQAMTGSQERFMDMVRTGYPQVYRANNVSFGALQPYAGGFVQDVFLTDPKGQAWIASYTLERQDDGSMKITGVQIRKSEELAV